MTDATYSGKSFLRTQATPSEPPPALAVGPIAWARKNLFSSPGSAALTILAVLFLAWVLPGLVRFLVTGRDLACIERRALPRQPGWGLLAVHLLQVRLLPLRSLSGFRNDGA